jgi:hypothetical protein
MDNNKISLNLQDNNTKEQLLNYCEDYEVDYRNSWNKAKLASVLEEKLLQTPEMLTRFLTVDQFEAIKKMIANGGSMEVNNVIPYISLILRGVATETSQPGSKVRITLVKEFNEVIAPVIDSILEDETLRHKDWLDRLICGIIMIYGILPEQEFLRLLNYFTGKSYTNQDFAKMLLERDRLLKEVKIHIYKEKFYYQSELMHEPDTILKELSIHKDLAYAKFTEEEILCYGIRDFLPEDPPSKALLKELERRGVSSADESIRFGWFLVQNDQKTGEIMKGISEKISFKDVDDINQFSRFVMDFINGLPRWILKGHTPEALFRKEKKFMKPLPADPYVPHRNDPVMQTAKKPGRNDPCTCGSGKKFKNCCGSLMRTISLN